MTLRNTGHRTAAVALIATLAMALGGFALTALGSGSDRAAAHASHPAAMTNGHAGTDQSAEIALNNAMRTLWGQHMEWTWSTVVAFAEESPALTPSLNRLLKNQADIGKAVAAYYGKAAGKQLTRLLTTHIKQAVPVLVAAKAGKQKALKRAVSAWYANARQIADFLAAANPNLPQKDLRQMMRTHITQTTAYAGAVLAGRYAKAIAIYNRAEEHMMMLSDALSAGIIAQFPDKF